MTFAHPVGTELQLRPQRPERARRPRLQTFDYRGMHAYHVVLTTAARQEAFVDAGFALECVEMLRIVSENLSFDLLAYCFMANYLHLLVQGTTDDAYLVRFVQRFKQVTAFSYKQAAGRRLWQQSFFDRVLRADEDVAAVAEYVFMNPITAGLVAPWDDYLLSGGTLFRADGANASSLRPEIQEAL